MKLKGMMRTHTCAELRAQDLDQEVTLCGWVQKSRDLGGLHFKDIRDRWGLTQLNFSEYKGETSVSLESTILAKGVVQKRPKEAINSSMETGEVEVLVTDFKVLSESDKDSLPFLPNGPVEATEDLRLKYRYLDLRSQRLQRILSQRALAVRKIRSLLDEESFTEVETPYLYKTTPEGARDYLVPSRVHPGKAYALPQSPQTLKQLLMIGGVDRYYQIVKCFRDEDLRADRQPEFTQVDLEASFVTQDFIHALTEKLVRELFSLDQNYTLEKMSFQQAMDRYGTDKPDLRFDLPQMNVTSVFKESEFKVFQKIAEDKGLIKSLFLPSSQGQLARKEIDALTKVVEPFGGRGVAWFKVQGEDISGGISKFISKKILQELNTLKEEKEQDGLWLFMADSKPSCAHACADSVRRHLAEKLELIDPSSFKALMVVDFPLLEYSEEDERFYALHHPFTKPKEEDMELFMGGKKDDLKKVRADAYDLVINGYEAAGGSVRIYDQKCQRQMFQVLGMSDQEIQEKFSFFVNALKYGTPPHAGIAFGLDRLVMLLAQTENIRDVMAFPKTTQASDLMSECPSSITATQAEELGLGDSKLWKDLP